MIAALKNDIINAAKELKVNGVKIIKTERGCFLIKRMSLMRSLCYKLAFERVDSLNNIILLDDCTYIYVRPVDCKTLLPYA
jgi:hypothetical protein